MGGDRRRLAPSAFIRAWHAGLDLVLPRVCPICDALRDPSETTVICGACWARLPLLPSPRCERCGHPTYDRGCRWCPLLPPFVRAGRSVCWAAGDVGLGFVHTLKYLGWHAAAPELALRMGRLSWPLDVIEERCGVVPVPLSAKRRRERGYNQSELLARALATRWRLPLHADALERTRHTETQTRLTPGERLRNVLGAFRASPSARSVLRGSHVVLVDDIVTTAATVNACAAALCDGGARVVSFVTFGRAPAIGDQTTQ